VSAAQPDSRAGNDDVARLHEALAAAQDRSYWLDRWQLDLNALMGRPGASELRAAIRALRSVYRALYTAFHWLRREGQMLPQRTAGVRRVVGEERSRAESAATPVGGAGSAAETRLRAAPVSQLLGERVAADDPETLVALQRADVLVDALGAVGGAGEPDGRWLGIGTGADAVLAVLGDAFPGLEVSENGAVDVAFALAGWGAGAEPLDRIDSLRDLVKHGGRLLLAADAGPASTLTPQRVLAHCTPDWRISLYRPGGMEGGRDLYVLDRT
jgi:hypothetical protein